MLDLEQSRKVLHKGNKWGGVSELKQSEKGIDLGRQSMQQPEPEQSVNIEGQVGVVFQSKSGLRRESTWEEVSEFKQDKEAIHARKGLVQGVRAQGRRRDHLGREVDLEQCRRN